MANRTLFASLLGALLPKTDLRPAAWQPSLTTQAVDREEGLNVGGFSDAVFELVADFAAGRMTGNHWVDRIAAVAV